jgi:hypothetical protein
MYVAGTHSEPPWYGLDASPCPQGALPQQRFWVLGIVPTPVHLSLLTLIRNCHQTGLRVYEVNDPNVDEATKLRNRTAELESLVRKLQGMGCPSFVSPRRLTVVFHTGKPHPR